jgi:tetratricopeptide (TPR) repeat protein
VVVCAVGASGCDELKSRRQIQRGNKLFNDGHYQKAVEEYEPALQRTPGLAIGHHNAGLAYFKLFQPGDTSPANLANANKAAEHFQAYLADNPDDSKIIALLTQVWMDSDQYEKALAYWEAELAKDPNNRDVISKLAGINRQAGRYDKALEWLHRRADLETQSEGKVNAYLEIAQLEWARLNKSTMVDEERLAVCDAGIAALQKAEALAPDNALVQSLMGSLYQHRALAHGASWAKLVETASQRYHQVKFSEISKAAKEAEKGAPGAATPSGQPTH